MDSNTNGMLQRVGQIAIPVQDLHRAIDFYRVKLGLPYLFTAGTLAFFDCGGVRLMLTLPEGTQEIQHGAVIYYAVNDIHTAYHTLVDRGVHFDDAPHSIAEMDTYDLWMAFLRDSEHNLIGIMGEIARG